LTEDWTGLVKTRCDRIRAQGYRSSYSDDELAQLAVGNGFAYQLCTGLFAAGLLFMSIRILTLSGAVAFLAVILP
jgi:hypothetical protein